MLNEGDSFGEQALYESSVRGLTVKAKENDVRCVALSRDSLSNILGAKINEVVNSNWSRWCLEKNDIFKNLTKVQIERIIKNVKFKQYDADTVVQDKGYPLGKLILVLGGDISYEGKTFGKGVAFGDQFMKTDKALEALLTENVKTVSKSNLAMLSISKFHTIIGGTLEKILVKNEESHEVRLYK